MKSIIFIFTVVSVFLAVSVESLVFILQLRGQKFIKWLGKNAFRIHMVITGFLWGLSFSLIALLQFEKHPLFHHSIVLKYAGLVLLASGLVMAVWGFKLLGLKRSFGLNFFDENVPNVKSSIYKFINNPEDYGFWMALIGFALFTHSLSNLVVALEFIVLMIPHMHIENIPIKRSISSQR